MALKIKKKASDSKKMAVITILGIQGGKELNLKNQAQYYFENNSDNKKEYFNTLALFIEKFHKKNYEIVPIGTKEANVFNKEVIKKGYHEYADIVSFSDKNLIKDEKDIGEIFKLYNNILDAYDEVIVDVTHGFRHLPLLMIVELIMQNFKSIDKIKHIYFAKEIAKHHPSQKGLYEIVDLKEYVDLANISFILTSFKNNFTVASHIQSKKYEKVIEALNDFSNDMMALNLNNLFDNSSKKLITELNGIQDVSINKQAHDLSKYIQIITFHEDKKRFKTYFDLAVELHEKNYMLISLSLLYESVRLYIKSNIKQKQKNLVEKIEDAYGHNLYKICNFFVKFKGDFEYKKFKKNWESDDNTKCIAIPLNESEFNTLKQLFPSELQKINKYLLFKKQKTLIDAIAHARNDLAHANATSEFKDIKKGIKDLLNSYGNICCKLAKKSLATNL